MTTQDNGSDNSSGNDSCQTASRTVQDTQSGSTISFRLVQLDELEDVHHLEADGFAPDEAASMSTLQYRHSVAPALFMGAYADGKLIGFVNATCSPSEDPNHDSRTSHDAHGNNVLIHSVCVARDRRRAKVATRMLRQYLERCLQAGYSTVVLICHSGLEPLFAGVGFEGREEREPSSQDQGVRPCLRMLFRFPLKNPARLLCPVERCRCVILREGVGRLTRMPESPLPVLEHLPSTKERSGRCWAVSSPTEFENIGFSKPIGPQQGGKERRWLSCGACDYGPLGWTESSGNLASQFSNNPQGRFANVLFLLEDHRVFTAPPQ